MSQQHAQFEEQFRDGPQPAPSYQEGYTGPQPTSYTVNVPPVQTYVNVPGQKLLAYELQSGRTPGVGARLALAIVSLVFTFLMFMVTLIVVAATRFDLFPIAPLAVSFSLIFAIMVIIINLIFNRRH
jgi:hypothetical protein